MFLIVFDSSKSKLDSPFAKQRYLPYLHDIVFMADS